MCHFGSHYGFNTFQISKKGGDVNAIEMRAESRTPTAKTSQFKESPTGRQLRRRNGQDFLEIAPVTNAELGNPRPILELIASSVIEILAGMRSVDQLASHLTDEVFVRLRARAARAASSRSESGSKALIPSLSVSKVTVVSPADGVIESVVLVRFPNRTRAVSIRMEGINRSWRATAISVI